MDPDYEAARAYIVARLQRDLPSGLLYHGLHHTLEDVLPAAERLAALIGVAGEALLLLRTAVLYHDAGYTEQYSANEEVGVRIARDTLPRFGYSAAQITIIEGLILATRLPQSPRTPLETVMADADMDSLGRGDYLAICHRLRIELALFGAPMSIVAWYTEQRRFLCEHRYFTAAANTLRGGGKRLNILLLGACLAMLGLPADPNVVEVGPSPPR